MFDLKKKKSEKKKRWNTVRYLRAETTEGAKVNNVGEQTISEELLAAGCEAEWSGGGLIADGWQVSWWVAAHV